MIRLERLVELVELAGLEESEEKKADLPLLTGVELFGRRTVGAEFTEVNGTTDIGEQSNGKHKDGEQK